jgi:hypothetical protein
MDMKVDSNSITISKLIEHIAGMVVACLVCEDYRRSVIGVWVLPGKSILPADAIIYTSLDAPS